MSEEERELHALIRSTTLSSLQNINADLKTWIERNAHFRDPEGSWRLSSATTRGSGTRKVTPVSHMWISVELLDENLSGRRTSPAESSGFSPLD